MKKNFLQLRLSFVFWLLFLKKRFQWNIAKYLATYFALSFETLLNYFVTKYFIITKNKAFIHFVTPKLYPICQYLIFLVIRTLQYLAYFLYIYLMDKLFKHCWVWKCIIRKKKEKKKLKKKNIIDFIVVVDNNKSLFFSKTEKIRATRTRLGNLVIKNVYKNSKKKFWNAGLELELF